jgi:hypothetical protein
MRNICSSPKYVVGDWKIQYLFVRVSQGNFGNWEVEPHVPVRILTRDEQSMENMIGRDGMNKSWKT